MSIYQFFRILWARRSIPITALVAALIGATLVILIVPPRYETGSRILMELVKPDPVTGEVVQSQAMRAYVATQMELIRDYRVAGRAVDTLGWTGSPDFAAQYRASGSTMDFRRWLAQGIIDRTQPQLIEGSNILEIKYSGTSPDQAAQVADALRDAYRDQTAELKQQTAAANAAWFREQAEKLRRDLAAAEKRKADFERANGIVINDDATDPESAKLNSIAAAGATQPTVTPAAPVAPAPSAMQTQLAQIDSAIATAQQTLGPNHPDLINLRQQRGIIAAAAAREAAAARAGGGAPTVSGPSIASQFSAQQSRVLAQRGKLAEARQLLIDVNVLRERLQQTTTRAEELTQQAQSRDTGLTYLGNSIIPQSPSFPNKPLILVGAIMAALGLGILASLLVELINRRVRSPEDLDGLGIPVLGVMAPSLPAPRRPLLSYLPGRAQPG